MNMYERCKKLVQKWRGDDAFAELDCLQQCADQLEAEMIEAIKPGKHVGLGPIDSNRIGILCEHCGCETNPYYWRTYIAGYLQCWSCGKAMEFTDVPQALTERLFVDRALGSSREVGGGPLPDHLQWHVGACECGASGVHVNTVTGLCRECTDVAKWRNVREHINAIDAMSTGDDIRNVLLLMLERMEAE